MTTPTHTSGAPLAGAPACPKCGGRMWDNRATKRNPKAPDFKCRDRLCDGVLWPGQHKAAVPILTAQRREPEDAPEPSGVEAAGQGEAPRAGGVGEAGACTTRASLHQRYLGVTDFVLNEVCPKYRDAGVPCTDATVAAIAATLFVATCRAGREGV